METYGIPAGTIFGPEPISYGPWVMSGSPRWHEPSAWLTQRGAGESSPQKVDKPRRLGGIASVHSVWFHLDVIQVDLVTTRETGSLLVTDVTLKGNVKRKHLTDLSRDVDRMAARAHAEAFGILDEFRSMEDSRHAKLTDEFLKVVAQVYVDGGTQGRKAVAQAYGKSPSTVDKWLTKAREAGILGPAPRRGRAGNTERKSQ